jgi:hypothetical protein
MTVSVVFAIAGVIALLFGIIGGGVKAREIEVPLLTGKARIVTILVGLALIGATFWLEINRRPAESVAPEVPVSGPSPAPTQPEVGSAQNNPGSLGPSNAASTPTPAGQDLDQLYSRLYDAKTWNLVLKENFDSNDANWTLWNVDDEKKTETMQIEDGLLLWGLTLKMPDRLFYDIAPVFSYTDFYYSVKARRIGPDPSENQAAWGVIFRRQGSNYYTFRVNDIQEYAVQIHSEDGWKNNLAGWTKSPFVEPGEFNEFTVIAEGQELMFFINGTPIGLMKDDTYSEGNVGLVAGLNFVRDEAVQFEFDDFELRQKP